MPGETDHTAAPRPSLHRYRARLLVGIMLLVASLTALGLFFVQRRVIEEAQVDLQKEFQSELSAIHRLQDLRHAALAERCRVLVRRPRIHAALEDNALDLLYLSARDELRDVMGEGEEGESDALPPTLRARFYRFLDGHGQVISPPAASGVGDLSPEEEAHLSLPQAPVAQQLGYLVRRTAARPGVDEIIAMPIISMETGEAIAALVLGFKPAADPIAPAELKMRSGFLVEGGLAMPGLSAPAREALQLAASRATAFAETGASTGLPLQVEETSHLLFCKRLNPGSLYPAAYELAVYPLTAALARQDRLRNQVLAGGGLLLLAGLLASHFLAARLSAPVERLEVYSEEDRSQRARAEAALELTHSELQRAARFSADASHQLKTPLTVLRAGLEELLAQNALSLEMREEISLLVHQTFRLSSMVEDLLLLSRMEGGRLQIHFESVNLMPLVESLADDLSAAPEPPAVRIESTCGEFQVAGETRYLSIILQNLLENARKYNCPGGEICVRCHEDEPWGVVTIANTGETIPDAVQQHIFERFHRGTTGENIAGHGLGLNLARDLARLHGGELSLLRSADGWTEFELRLRLFAPEADSVAHP